jgi:hypothetical protein
MLLDGDVDGGGVAAGGQAEEVGGDAREGCGGEGDGAVEGGGGGGGLGGEEGGGWTDTVRGTGRRPCIEGLVEGYRAAGHGVAVRVEEAKGDLAGSGLEGEALGSAGDGFKGGVLGTGAKGGEGDALAGAVEAGADGVGLALSERTRGEGLGGDAVGVGEDGSAALNGDAVS